MSATEHELKAAQSEGAQKELQLRQAREEGAREIKAICNAREALLERVKELDKRQNELCGDGGSVMEVPTENRVAYFGEKLRPRRPGE